MKKTELKKIHQVWDSLGLSDNFIFTKVMRNERLCKRMLETILSTSIDHIEYIATEKVIDESMDAHGVRLDVYVKDAAQTVYNVECQTTNTKELPKRSRYYQSAIDFQELSKGSHYRELPRSIIIFICTFDLYGQGRHIYTFENRCLEDGKLSLQDDTKKIFLSTEGTADDIDTELKDFLDFVGGKEVSSEFARELTDALRKAKANMEWRREYMTLYMRDLEKKEEGKIEERARINSLNKALTHDDRMEDLKRSLYDTEFQERLMREYGI